MTIEEAVRSHLVSFVAAIAGRVDPVNLKASPTLPACTYRRISSTDENSHDGYSGLTKSMFQLGFWGDTYLASKAAAKQGKTAFRGYKGTMGSAPGVRVDATFVRDETDAYAAGTLNKHVTILDVEIWHAD